MARAVDAINLPCIPFMSEYLIRKCTMNQLAHSGFRMGPSSRPAFFSGAASCYYHGEPAQLALEV